MVLLFALAIGLSRMIRVVGGTRILLSTRISTRRTTMIIVVLRLLVLLDIMFIGTALVLPLNLFLVLEPRVALEVEPPLFGLLSKTEFTLAVAVDTRFQAISKIVTERRGTSTNYRCTSEERALRNVIPSRVQNVIKAFVD